MIPKKVPEIVDTSSIFEMPKIQVPPPPTQTPLPIQTETTDKLNIPIVKEITFGGKVIPKPPCLYGQIYNDKARKCVCPLPNQTLFKEKCVEVKCMDGYVFKKSGIGKNGNYVICINSNGETKKVLTQNLDIV